MTADIKIAIEMYFNTKWTTTPIQYEGVKLATIPDKYIGLIYNPVLNEQYAFDGTTTGRIRHVGIQKVFCYAKSTTLAYKLADDVKTFLNGLELNGIVFQIGQDRSVLDLENGYFECLVQTELVKFN